MAFDAEIYLRLLGEGLLDDPGLLRPGYRSQLRDAAAALVVAGTIAADRAWRVIDDYATAARIRAGEPGFVHFGPPSRRHHDTRALLPRQTWVINHEISFRRGQLLLRDVAITPAGGLLRYRWRRDALGSSPVAHLFVQPSGFPWGGTAPEIIDADGNRPVVHPGRRGGDSEDHWDGEFELCGTIAPQSGWLQVDGTRIALVRRTARSEVGIEELDDQGPLERLLWRRLAVAEMPSGLTADLGPSIQALLAAGALDEGSPLLKDLLTVAVCMPSRPLRQRPAPVGSTRGLVEPWGSLLRRLGRDDGPEWTLVIDTLTPPCDGIQFAAYWITSDLAGFELEFEVAPNVLAVGALDELPVAWWARDDRANHYLGAPTDWHASDDGTQGTIRYWPALDPRAKRLDLLVCVESHQAVISVSIPEGSEDSA